MQKNLPQKPLNAEQIKAQAKRALKEAQQRREQTTEQKLAIEKNGRDGPEATRFGDWEKNGIASDF